MTFYENQHLGRIRLSYCSPYKTTAGPTLIMQHQTRLPHVVYQAYHFFSLSLLWTCLQLFLASSFSNSAVLENSCRRHFKIEIFTFSFFFKSFLWRNDEPYSTEGHLIWHSITNRSEHYGMLLEGFTITESFDSVWPARCLVFLHILYHLITLALLIWIGLSQIGCHQLKNIEIKLYSILNIFKGTERQCCNWTSTWTRAD